MAEKNCPLCGGPSNTLPFCDVCISSIKFLGVECPAEDATEEQIKTWMKDNKVQSFRCGVH